MLKELISSFRGFPMKTKLGLLVVVMMVLVGLLLINQGGLVMSQEKTSAPKGSSLGVTDGQLAPCKDSPNCVSSQAEGKHYLEAFDYQDLASDQQKLIEIIDAMPNSELVVQEEDYIRAEFSTKFFGFVDDVEFYFSQSDKKIHFRSAARSGYWDLGVNKRRIEEIREKFVASN